MGSPAVHFMEEVNLLVETDYGDFMRKVNSYLAHLEEQESAHVRPAIDEKLAEMKEYIQYHPNWDIPSTRKKILRDADVLITLESQNSS